MKPLAILYSRFSSEKQAGGDSVRRQNENATRFCDMHNLELSELTFKDWGVSGWKAVKRDGLENLLDAVIEGRIPKGSYILVEAADRLSRRGWDHCLTLVKDLVATGCKFVTIDNGQIYDQHNIKGLSSVLPLMISADLAMQESDRKAQRVREAKANIRKTRRITGKQPFWITIVDGEPTLNERAPIARQIVDLRLKGWSPQRIARKLNEEGSLSPTGKAWGCAIIRRTIENTSLKGTKTYYEKKAGEYQPAELVANLYPEVCSLEEFEKIQRKEVGKKGGKPAKGPFANLLKCYKCGRAMNTRTGHLSNGGKYKYKLCLGAIQGGCDHNGTFKNADEILLSQLKELGFARSKAPACINYDPMIAEATTKIENLQVMRNKFREEGKFELFGMILEDIQKETDKLEEFKRLRMMENEVHDDVDLSLIVDIEDVSEQNKRFREAIEKITLQKLPDGKTAIYKVRFHNGYRIAFSVVYGRSGHTIQLKSDGQQLTDWVNSADNDLQPWELGQEEE